MSGLYIPAATIEKLLHPARPGQRHQQMLAIALSLIGNGFHPDAVAVQLRRMFPSSGPDAIPDEEIEDIVDGVLAYNPQPSIPQLAQGGGVAARLPRQPPKPTPAEAQRRVEEFLAGFRCSAAELRERSPAPIPQGAVEMAIRFLFQLYGQTERLNIVWEHQETKPGKAVPTGYGHTLAMEAWAAKILEQEHVPHGPAGGWVRLNPVDGAGISNKNVVAFRHALVEFDDLPLELQLSFFARLKLPIAALVTSGGRSVHAWVRIEATGKDEYAKIVRTLLESLEPFGVDQANKNPSRLARLPGAVRSIGSVGDGLQRLLFLNPHPAADQVIADLPVSP